MRSVILRLRCDSGRQQHFQMLRLFRLEMIQFDRAQSSQNHRALGSIAEVLVEGFGEFVNVIIDARMILQQVIQKYDRPPRRTRTQSRRDTNPEESNPCLHGASPKLRPAGVSTANLFRLIQYYAPTAMMRDRFARCQKLARLSCDRSTDIGTHTFAAVRPTDHREYLAL